MALDHTPDQSNSSKQLLRQAYQQSLKTIESTKVPLGGSLYAQK
jgi:hypothetical protein